MQNILLKLQWERVTLLSFVIQIIYLSNLRISLILRISNLTGNFTSMNQLDFNHTVGHIRLITENSRKEIMIINLERWENKNEMLKGCLNTIWKPASCLWDWNRSFWHLMRYKVILSQEWWVACVFHCPYCFYFYE